jgi:hypothetical protein
MSIKMRGAQARNLMAAELVHQYGRRALAKCSGAMKAAVERELAFRDRASVLDNPAGMTMSEWRAANPEPTHGCGHMQGRGAA